MTCIISYTRRAIIFFFSSSLSWLLSTLLNAGSLTDSLYRRARGAVSITRGFYESGDRNQWAIEMAPKSLYDECVCVCVHRAHWAISSLRSFKYRKRTFCDCHWCVWSWGEREKERRGYPDAGVNFTFLPFSPSLATTDLCILCSHIAAKTSDEGIYLYRRVLYRRTMTRFSLSLSFSLGFTTFSVYIMLSSTWVTCLCTSISPGNGDNVSLLIALDSPPIDLLLCQALAVIHAD